MDFEREQADQILRSRRIGLRSRSRGLRVAAGVWLAEDASSTLPPLLDPPLSAQLLIMPLLRYNEIFCAQEHEFGITAVAFSSQNTLLATAGLDGKVCLWDVRTHALLHTYKNDTAIVCMDWKSQSEDTLVIGYQDGNVATLSLTAVGYLPPYLLVDGTSQLNGTSGNAQLERILRSRLFC